MVLIGYGVVHGRGLVTYDHVRQQTWVGHDQGHVVAIRRLINWKKHVIGEILNSVIQYHNYEVVAGGIHKCACVHVNEGKKEGGRDWRERGRGKEKEKERERKREREKQREREREREKKKKKKRNIS